MDYLYYMANASLTLRIVEHLHKTPGLPLRFMSVIHQTNGWVVRVKMANSLTTQQEGDLRAFLNELGVPFQAGVSLKMALLSLETGASPVEVMHRYQVPVICHGSPDCHEIEAFRHQFIQGLGYCPETLA